MTNNGEYTIFSQGEYLSIPSEFGEALNELKAKLDMQLWLIVNREINDALYRELFAIRNEINEDKCALIIQSYGGEPHAAFRIARLFQRHTKCFCPVVLSYAKSAATLIAISGNKLYMAKNAELGPIDVQLLDAEREEYNSALDAVQALERLNSFALSTFDKMMFIIAQRAPGKRLDVLIPLSIQYATELVKPLMASINAVDYTKKSRDLKIGEEYAKMLIQNNPQVADVAEKLTKKYPTHGYVIDRNEVEKIGISLENLIDFGRSVDMIYNLNENIKITGMFKNVLESEQHNSTK